MSKILDFESLLKKYQHAENFILSVLSVAKNLIISIGRDPSLRSG
jgi:hypothetical protein